MYHNLTVAEGWITNDWKWRRENGPMEHGCERSFRLLQHATKVSEHCVVVVVVKEYLYGATKTESHYAPV